jgi:glycosyltransferase involved in cell wall biosynthesis
MRILFYTNWYVKQTIPLANALAEENDVTVIFPEVEADAKADDGSVPRSRLETFLHRRVRLFTYPHMQGVDPLGLTTVWQVRRRIRELRPEVIHFNESYDFRCLLLMWLFPRIRFVTTVHDPVSHPDEQISLRRFKHWVRDQIRRRSNALIVYGDALRAVLTEVSGISADRIYSVPHGEFAYYTYFDRNPPAKSGNGVRNILFFGRWSHYKGMDVLIDAEPLIARRVPNIRIILAGEGALSFHELQPRIQNPAHFEIKNYAIPDDEVPELFRKADVVVFPYRQAAQSGPLHIAGIFARPIVATNVGALPEVVKHQQTGLLVPPDDPEKLADAVSELLLDREKAARLGEAARRSMAAEESMERVARLHLNIYREMTRN